MALQCDPIIPGFLSDSCLDCLDYSAEKTADFYLKSTFYVLISLLNEEPHSMEERQLLWGKLSVISNRLVSYLQAQEDLIVARHYLILAQQAFLQIYPAPRGKISDQSIEKVC